MEGLLTPPISSVSCEASLRISGVTDPIRFCVIMFSAERSSKKKKREASLKERICAWEAMVVSAKDTQAEEARGSWWRPCHGPIGSLKRAHKGERVAG